MKSMMRALAAVAVILALAGSAYGADLELYVKNKAFKGPTATRQGKLFAALDGVLDALGWSWRLTGDRVDVTRTAGGGPTLPGGALQVVVDGNALTVPVADVGGRALVDVQALASATGLSYKASPQLGTADLMVPVKAGAVTGNWGRQPEPAASPSGGGESGEGGETAEAGGTAGSSGGGASAAASDEPIVTDGTNKESPIEVVKIDFSDSTTPGANFVGEVRVSTTIKNTSDEDDLENVKLALRLTNQMGDTLQEWVQQVGTLKAGEEYSFTPEPPVWYNNLKIKIEPKVLVEHAPIPPKDEEKPAEGK